MSPEEKAKKMKKGRRKVSRKNMMKRSDSIRMLSIKMGRYIDQLRILHEENEVVKDAVDTCLGTIENLLLLPTIQKELNAQAKIEDGKEECPTCGKRFKQLKRHKCKKSLPKLDVPSQYEPHKDVTIDRRDEKFKV